MKEGTKQKLRRAALRQFREKGNPFQGKKHTEEAKQKMRVAAASRVKGFAKHRSKLETRFGDWLCNAGLAVDSQKRIDYYVVDFAFERGIAKFVIEIDGCFYHACRRCFPNGAFGKAALQRTKDRRKTEHLTRMGWIVLRVTEHDIKEYGKRLAGVIAKSILDFINDGKRKAEAI